MRSKKLGLLETVCTSENKTFLAPGSSAWASLMGLGTGFLRLRGSLKSILCCLLYDKSAKEGGSTSGMSMEAVSGAIGAATLQCVWEVWRGG